MAEPEVNPRHMGVIAFAALDFGRAILRGVQAWCRPRSGWRMNLISESGYSPGMPIAVPSLGGLVVQYSEEEGLHDLAEDYPHLVITSNREKRNGVARVLNDDVEVGRLGAQYLLSRKHQEFCYLGLDGMQFSREREEGFAEVIRAEGKPLRFFRIQRSEDLAKHLPEILSFKTPLALMVASDLVARWLIESMEEPLDWIPHRISILGVDDDSLQQALSSLPISSIALSGERVGFEAAELSFQLYRNERPPGTLLRVPPSHVISRQSTDYLAIRDRTLSRALRLMRERMGEIGDAGELVKMVGIPRRTLETRFKRATGKTLAAELAEVRIHRARELLATTNLSVKEIAFLVGFSEPRMLTLVFRRIAGELPSQYRNRVRIPFS